MLPRKIKRPKMGVRPPERKIFMRHRRHVKSHGCSVPGCNEGPIEFAHVRSAANAGKDIKPHDAFGISLCRKHHRWQHNRGADSFERQFGVSMWKLAGQFVRTSPDLAMRESFNALPEHLKQRIAA